MPDIPSLEILLRYLIVALPALVLAVLFFLLAASRRTETVDQAEDVAPTRDASAKDAAAAQTHRESTLQSQPLTAWGFPLLHTPVPAPVHVPAAPTVLELTPQEAQEEATRLEAEITRAEDAEETVELAKLYLALGKARMVLGEEAAGLEALRSAAGLAGLYKAQRVHAEARLELAEAAVRHGDPTTACEHWQMARMAFLEDGAKAEGERIDRRMRAQGCPTDWVLTDF